MKFKKKGIQWKESIVTNIYYIHFLRIETPVIPDLPESSSLYPHIVYSINVNEKPLPQDNNSEVLRALNDQHVPQPGVAGMAELQENRTKSMIDTSEGFILVLPYF